MSPRTKEPFEAFKPIRNLLRKYDTVSLAREAAAKLHEIEAKPGPKWQPSFAILVLAYLSHPPSFVIRRFTES